MNKNSRKYQNIIHSAEIIMKPDVGSIIPFWKVSPPPKFGQLKPLYFISNLNKNEPSTFPHFELNRGYLCRRWERSCDSKRFLLKADIYLSISCWKWYWYRYLFESWNLSISLLFSWTSHSPLQRVLNAVYLSYDLLSSRGGSAWQQLSAVFF